MALAAYVFGAGTEPGLSRSVRQKGVAEFDHGVDAAAAVDGSAPSTAWKTAEQVFHERPDRFPSHAIAAKISGAVAGSVGAVSCFIDSALK
jgi:hypothetical protein